MHHRLLHRQTHLQIHQESHLLSFSLPHSATHFVGAQFGSVLWQPWLYNLSALMNVKPEQADVCHAYQLLGKGGLKEQNIVVFMYDDIAFDEENLRPEVTINNQHGSDVYEGSKGLFTSGVKLLDYY